MTGFASKKEMAMDKLFDRDAAEQTLVDGDFDYIMQTDNGLELLRDYLLLGFKGYANFTDAELIAEIKERKQMGELE
jgi:hypothetical protein